MGLDEYFDGEVLTHPYFLISALMSSVIIIALTIYWDAQGFKSFGFNWGTRIFFVIIAIIFSYFWAIRKMDG